MLHPTLTPLSQIELCSERGIGSFGSSDKIPNEYNKITDTMSNKEKMAEKLARRGAAMVNLTCLEPSILHLILSLIHI